MTEPVRTLIDELIEAQRRLDTPVARFAAAHDHAPAAAPRSQLIPLSAPGPGEQYAFEVDLDSCTGCKACVAGCHSLNGLDEEETWRDVGLVLGGPESHPFQQTVTTACHHCEDPACLNGCPVLAYEKDPVTGIVVHLDDQCIGCSYCVLKCPYEVPKYNDRLGIVRKCDMCHGRLAAGEAPACVQACPTEAIAIVKVSTFRSETPNPELAILSSTDSAYTRPTTRYISKNPLPANVRAADADTLRPQHAHYALVFLLVLTQLGLGLLAAAYIGREFDHTSTLALSGLGLFAAGLVVSVAHLGQPFRAWRIFLGLRRSWLSREAVLLGTAFPFLIGASASKWVLSTESLSSIIRPLTPVLNILSPLLLPSGLIIGLLGVFCSAMIYTDTRRRFWRLSQTLGRMGGSVAVATFAGLAVAVNASEWSLLAAATLTAKLALELTTYRGSSASARLQQGALHRLWGARVMVGGLATLLFASQHPAVACFFFTLGEVLERTLFFRAVDSPKMPGVPST
jgi:Fe-S-cluster-containing dehydrogenase component/DMSO reductase anchor subunit